MDKNMSRESALMDIYRVMRPGEPPTEDASTALFDTLFSIPTAMTCRRWAASR